MLTVHEPMTTMKRFSRCAGCGSVNDANAPLCYLCGSTSLLTTCPLCDAPLDNPLHTICPSCGMAYARSICLRRPQNLSASARER
ncbi:MAG: zinc ribbon domain-containing protein [Armatimonadetes bacterium]|nr:zinc ribbon domain-containing protein [Armatimonadota bacterium]